MRLAPIVLGLACLASSAAALPDTLRDGYHDSAQVERQLAAWGAEHGDLVTVSAIGRSAGGSPILVARVAAEGEIAPDRRPAIFVGANVAGFHNAGTEAVLALLRRLLDPDEAAGDLLGDVTFYVAPILNPDAHDGFFGTPRARRAAAAGRLDRDRDGLSGEDGPDDLDGDGVITRLRIPDPSGEFVPDVQDPRIMVRKGHDHGRSGAFRFELEGDDDDGDGRFNEDPPRGIAPDRNFPHAFPFPEPDAGPWPSAAPETRAILDFLLARRNVAAAVVFGPANSLLAPARPAGERGGAARRLEIPPRFAARLGVAPGTRMTLDEAWERASTLPFVEENRITKDRLAALLGAGPATEWDPEDRSDLERFAERYRERLEAAGLDTGRPAASPGKGGLTTWLYFQYGAFAVELDVWGVPRREEARRPEPREGMASAEEGGRERPKAGERRREIERRREVYAWVDEHAPSALTPWTEVRLADGRTAEVGGLDPLVTLNPPAAVLRPALAAHVEAVLDLARRLPRLTIAATEARGIGGKIFEVRAVAANEGELPTHTRQAARAQVHLPVRLSIELPPGGSLVTGRPWVTSERLAGVTGTLEGVWLVRAPRGGRVTVEATCDTCGIARRTLDLGGVER